MIDALLFSLAIAVGITPQLLPAVVSTSLATGSRRLAQKKVLVKRLVCIEDLGDIDVLFTDKTGTLTEGQISFERAMDPAGDDSQEVLRLGLVVQRGHRDRRAPRSAATRSTSRCGSRPAATAVRDRRLPPARDRALRPRPSLRLGPGRPSATSGCSITKGAPETVLERCVDVPDEARRGAGARVRRRQPGGGGRHPRRDRTQTTVTPSDEHDLHLAGFLIFLDQPKPSAARLDRPPRRASASP